MVDKIEVGIESTIVDMVASASHGRQFETRAHHSQNNWSKFWASPSTHLISCTTRLGYFRSALCTDYTSCLGRGRSTLMQRLPICVLKGKARRGDGV